jgi:hypothetical protein
MYRRFLSILKEALKEGMQDQRDENRPIMRVAPGIREEEPAIYSYVSNDLVNRDEVEQFFGPRGA